MGLPVDVVSLLRTARVSSFPGDVFAILSLGIAYALRRRDSPRVLHPLSLDGESVLVRPGTRDLVTYHDVFVRGYHATRHHGTDVRTVLDLGANTGLVSRWLAKTFPDAEIVAVEMDRDNFSLLRQNLEILGHRVQLVHAAVWTHEDGVSYSLESSEDAYAVQQNGREAPGPPVRVPSVTPDSLVDLFGGRPIDLVKMDLEGAEAPLLLEADTSWLARVRCLNVEVHEPEFLEPITGALSGAGFRVEAGKVHWSSLEAWR